MKINNTCGNPVYWSAPSGADATSIYHNGELMGWQFTGEDAKDIFMLLTGQTAKQELEVTVQIIMKLSSFDKDGEGSGSSSNNSGGDKKNSFLGNRNYKSYNDFYQQHLKQKFLNNFTFEDAIYHYNFGKGEPVYVNLSSLNFDGITVERF